MTDLAPASLFDRSDMGRLTEVHDFGSNPGNLRMHVTVPADRRRTRPLVVVLHGCGQAIEGFDAASRWSEFGATHDFLVLYPGQQQANNRQGCFSWFEPEHVRRGLGEVASIRQMVATAVATIGADPMQIFVCGLSAGGAMAGAMLATYPETFRGGAIIAGLPYGTASSLSEAYDSMSTGKVKDPKAWGDIVRSASSYRGPWPAISVWHGMADDVVKPINAGELVKQWTNVHGVGAEVPMESHVGKIVRRVWIDAANRACVTEYSVPGIGHGAPVDDVDPPAPFFLPAGISSTRQIAEDWGLSGRVKRRGIKTLFWRRPGVSGFTEPFRTAPVADARAPHRE